MVIFYVSDRHGAVCLSVSCDVLWCLALSLSPVALGTNPRLSISFLFLFFCLFCIHPCCSLLCPPLPLRMLHASLHGDACAILLPRSQKYSVLGSKVTETPLETLPEGSSSAVSKGRSEHRACSCPLCA